MKKLMSLQFALLVLLAGLASVGAVPDLSEFPDAFIGSDGNVLTVIGEEYIKSDALAGITVMVGVTGNVHRRETPPGEKMNKSRNITYEETEPIAVGKVYRVSEVAWPPERPVLLVGSPCSNGLTKMLLEEDEPCWLPVEGAGIVKVIEYEGMPVILMYGDSEEGTRFAAQALSYFDQFKGKFVGTAVLVTGTSNEYVITQLEDPEQYARVRVIPPEPVPPVEEPQQVPEETPVEPPEVLIPEDSLPELPEEQPEVQIPEESLHELPVEPEEALPDEDEPGVEEWVPDSEQYPVNEVEPVIEDEVVQQPEPVELNELEVQEASESPEPVVEEPIPQAVEPEPKENFVRKFVRWFFGW